MSFVSFSKGGNKMNLLCLLFGIGCQSPQTTRWAFAPIRVPASAIEAFDRLSASTRRLLEVLSEVDVHDLTREQLEEVRVALEADGAYLEAVQVTYLIRDRKVRECASAIAELDAELARLQDLVEQTLTDAND